jgi:hypothetical protein
MDRLIRSRGKRAISQPWRAVIKRVMIITDLGNNQALIVFLAVCLAAKVSFYSPYKTEKIESGGERSR